MTACAVLQSNKEKVTTCAALLIVITGYSKEVAGGPTDSPLMRDFKGSAIKNEKDFKLNNIRNEKYFMWGHFGWLRKLCIYLNSC